MNHAIYSCNYQQESNPYDHNVGKPSKRRNKNMSNDPVATDELHIVMFPWFAFGHISPFVQLSNRLSLHGVRVSFLSAPGNVPRIKSSLLLSPKIQIFPLPIPPVDGLSPDLENTSEMTPAEAELLKKALDLMQPQITTLLSNLKPQFVVCDVFQHWLPKLASAIGVKTLCFSVFSVVTLAYLAAPSRNTSCSNNTLTVEHLMEPPNGFPPISFTSMKKFQAEDFLYVYKSFEGGPTVFHRVLGCVKDCSAMIIKTCREMEGPYVDFLEAQFGKPFLLAGPLVPDPPSGILEEKWLKWLGQFPPKSVIYCSFGSETFLTDEQTQELAVGLGQTFLPFVLVLNFPAGVDAEAQMSRSLPEGFIDRVKDRAVVHTGWVQQQLILGHGSVGCYLCHSGFSSVTEALVNDCQLVLLPIKGDQYLNAKLIAGDMKAGVEVYRRNEDGHFGKDDIYEAVKTVMVEVAQEPGVSVRANHKKWREFLLDREMHSKFIVDLVHQLKALA